MTIYKAYLLALRTTVTLTSILGRAPGLYDMFPDSFPGYIGPFRDAKRCERCERCSCKDFPTGVKILVENFVKGGVNKC